MKTKALAILGFGARGQIYSTYAKSFPEKFRLVAVTDTDEDKLRVAREQFGVTTLFSDYRDFLNAGIKADLVVIATQDAQHVEHATACMKCGYDLLLEKPAAVTAADCLTLLEAANRYERKVYVCHVLRYTPFYRKVKSLIDSGAVGEVVTINASESVGYFHQAHSFVRGPWRNSQGSGPMILTKCCHDMDILRWLMDEPCLSVNSRGDLHVFKTENAPAESTAYCSDCPLSPTCIYSAQTLYSRDTFFGASYFCKEPPTKENILRQVWHTPYDRCVFHCDNDVVDHQVTVMQFANGKTAAHTMTAFSKNVYRDIKIHGTKAELVGLVEDNFLELRPFGGETQTFQITLPKLELKGHSGGDYYLMNDLFDELNGKKGSGITYLDVSLESHLMAFAAEQSRLSDGRTQYLKDL